MYDIPLRSLYSRNIANLMMAGRNISASYVAFTSARVMATCAAEGQAIGTAAAQAIESNLLPRDLAHDRQQVAHLQQTLLRDDQTIKALRNQDPLDLALQATVSVSAEVAKAALVLDGFVREKAHQWAAPVSAGSPAWIELRWDTPRRSGSVQKMTFDTGFERQLTLSAQESQNVN